MYLKDDTLLKGKEETRSMKYMSSWYLLRDDKLYKRGILFALLKCLNEEEAATTIKEVNEGICRVRHPRVHKKV